MEIFILHALSLGLLITFARDLLFVFDSSSLLELYNIPKPTRSDIYQNVFEKLLNKLWIPSHVQYEYLKNRHSVITKPITEKYTPLKKDITDLVSLVSKDLNNKIESIINKTKNNNIHPYLEQESLLKFKEKVNIFNEDAEAFKEGSNSIIEEKEKEIKDVEKDDDVLKAITNNFSVGRDYQFDEIIEITKEGKHRFEFDIPPGYGDSKAPNRKKGTQIFGDLIIWKQILEHSKESKKPIIFVTNDIKKDGDWCYLDKKKDDRIERPREELIKEMKDYSGVDFWMYSLPQFLHKTRNYLKSDLKEETIENISKQMKVTENYNNLTKRILGIINLFNALYPRENYNSSNEVIEPLIKYINVLAPELTVLSEESMSSYNADLTIKENDKVVLVDITFAKSNTLLNKKTETLLNSLALENLSNGIIYAPRFNNPNSFKFGSISKNVNGNNYQVSQVFGNSRD